MQVYFNDRIVPIAEAKISVLDHGFLYGDGIYETLRVYDGVVFMFDEHIQRLFRSATLIGLDIPKTADGIRSAIYDTLRANKLADAYVRITISRGYGPLGLDPDLCKEPTFVVMTNPFSPYPSSYYTEGIRIMIPQVRRNLKEALDPRIKSLNFLNNILAKIEAKKVDALEAVMVNSDGFLTEGTVTNIFFVKDGHLCTPSVDCGILDGITRTVILDLAGRNSIPVIEGQFSPEYLSVADEVFVSNTTMEVMPVGRVDGHLCKVGEITHLLLSLYRQEAEAYVKEKKGSAPSLWE
ncbi:MAG: aminotransferase class IV [Thermodesulfovibrionales bacterium]|jgi:branched-chain amino acid aminotransferase